MSEQSGRYQRSASGLVGALVVLLMVIGGYMLLRALNHTDPASPTPSVGYHQAARYARQQAAFTVLAPPRLPHGWRATTVGFTPKPDQHWHLGVLTDQNRYVGLEQGDQSVHSMVRAYVAPHPRPGRPATVGGDTWATWTDQRGDLALVRRAGNTTTLVIGHDVPRARLAAYVASLR